MRAVLKVKSNRPAGTTLKLEQFQCDMWRDFGIRIEKTGANEITAKAYLTEALAIVGGADHIASGTGVMGDRVAITLTAIAVPPFAFGSMKAIVSSDGAPVYAAYAYTGAVAARVMTQMISILGDYTAANEALDSIVAIQPGSLVEEPAFPRIAIEMLEGFSFTSRGGYTLALQCAIWVFTELTSGGYADALAYGEQIMGIAIDEQRTWGGMVLDTKPRGAVTPAPAAGVRGQEDEEYMWAAQVPLTITVADILASKGPNYPEYEGGKYGTAYR